ncbi:MAG: hypothetical protein AAGI07_08845, partial [Bacteroidota bacterium]
IKRVLQQVVTVKSNGLYQLDFEKGSFSFFTKEVSINNLSFKLNKNKLEELRLKGKEYQLLYEFHIPEVSMDASAGSLKDAWLEKTLMIDDFHIVNPTLKLTADKQVARKNKKPRSFNDLFFLISGYLNLFRVEHFSLENASINFTDTASYQYSLQEFNVEINGFQVDSTSQMVDGKPFYVEDIRCNIGKNELQLPQQGYRVSFDKLQTSISKESFYLAALRVVPINKNSIEKEGLNASIPELRIEGLNYSKAYFDSVFIAKDISLHRPFIDARFLAKQNVEDKTDATLSYEKVSKFINSLAVGKVLLDSASLYFNVPEMDIEIDDFSLTLDNVWFDEAAWEARKQRFFADDFDFKLRNYIADLPDQVHRLQALELGVSSNRNYAYCNNVFISPRDKNINIRALNRLGQDKVMNFYLSRIELTGMDIWQAYLDNRLTAGTFRINRPRLEVNHFLSLAERIAEMDRIDSLMKLRLETFPDTLAMSESDSLFINDDYPELTDSIVVVSDSLVLEDVQEIQDRFFSEENDLPVILPDTTLKNISLTTFLLNYYDSLDAARADSVKYLAITDSLESIDRDSLILADIYASVKNTFTRVDIRKVDINEAQFNYNECVTDTVKRIQVEEVFVDLEKFSLYPNAHLDTNTLFFSEKIEISSQKLAYYLPDSIHFVDINNLTFSTSDSTIKAGETWYTPTNRNRNFITENIGKVDAIFDLKLQSFLVTGVNFKEVLSEQKYIFESLNIEKPNIFQFIPANALQDSVTQEIVPIVSAENLSTSEIYTWQPQLSDYIQEFKINAIDISEGFYSLAKVAKRTREVISARKLQLCAKEFLLDSISLTKNTILPFATDFEILAENYFLNLPDSIHIFEAKNIGISYSSKALYLYNITIQPSAVGKRNKKVNKYALNVPEFRLDGIDWERLYFENELYVEELLIDRPLAALKTLSEQPEGEKLLVANQSQQEDFDPEIFYRDALSVFESIEIDRMILSRGEVNWDQIAENNILQNVKTDRLDISVNTFKINDSEGYNPGKFFFSEDVNVNVKNYIHSLPDNWHTIRASELRYSSATSAFFATFVHYAPKNWADMDFLEENATRKNSIDIYTPELSFNGFDLGKLLFENDLYINNFQLEKPKFRAALHTGGQITSSVASSRNFNTADLDTIFKSMFNHVEIANFQFDEAELVLGVHPQGDQSMYLTLDKIFAKVENLNNYLVVDGYPRFMLADDIQVGVRDYGLNLPDSIYRFESEELGFSTGKKLVYIDDLDIKPRVSKKTIAELFGHEIDWIHLNAAKLELENFDFEQFIADEALQANQLNIDRLDAYVYRDKRPPSAFGSRPSMPQQFLREMKTYIKLDTVNLYNSKLTYEERASDGTAPGQIYFDNLNAYAYNITNDPDLLAEGATALLFANALLMGEGRLEAAFTFPINNENNSFTYQGSLEPMDLRAINPMLENVAGLKVNSGGLRKLTFDVQADREYADGFMRFYYKNLNVALLKKDAKPKKQGKIKGLLTMFANVLVKSKNPRFLFLKRGKIYAERDKSKSIFNYWAKTILSGLKHSVGFSYEKPPKERRKTVFQFWKKRRKDFRQNKEKVK